MENRGVMERFVESRSSEMELARNRHSIYLLKLDTPRWHESGADVQLGRCLVVVVVVVVVVVWGFEYCVPVPVAVPPVCHSSALLSSLTKVLWLPALSPLGLRFADRISGQGSCLVF